MSRLTALGLSVLCLQAGISAALVTERSPVPTIHLDEGLFIGNASGNVSKFLGIPFTLPPVGDLRFRLPVPNHPYKGVHNATAYGSSCIQQSNTLPVPTGLSPGGLAFLQNDLVPSPLTPDDEDCLTINIVTPANANKHSKLPVLFWIFGGGFEGGGTSNPSLDGGVIVERSLQLKEPVIHVGMNYRLNGLGFLASAEVQKAGVGNLGLQDQRQAMRWVQKYISAFGGDPEKVTIWGESAGAISVGMHMITNGGHTEGLFRAAIMQSGSPTPIGSITHGQPYYDGLVKGVGCSGAADTLHCLRHAPIAKLRAAINASPGLYAYQSLVEAWTPRADGVFLKDAPQKLVQKGSVAKVPFITGNCDDEGTLFSLSTTNITTDQQVHDYIAQFYLKGAPDSDVQKLLKAYPNDTTVGSPFGTGTENAVTPQFKRLAAIQGDVALQAPRRFFVQERSSKQPVWSFLSKRLKTVPDFGSVHGSDLQFTYGPGDLTDYFIRFANNLNPNGVGSTHWPQYSNECPKQLTLWDGPTSNITEDTYRVEGFKVLTELTLAHPV
ncbi:carotenoid ester lipase precursor [Artomyces pyxidatus]|uniref:Carotenoid ester lipase n=1 Tax=Artomyces pyxidatus TaxID=48021 RepID=A0ACB8SVF6_9AGAM|nr:carotenoid ester lipase precursor [Artomyces pyxidatus]